MNLFKRFTLVGVAAVMAVTLAACNNKKEDNATTTTSTTETADAQMFPKLRERTLMVRMLMNPYSARMKVTLVNFWFEWMCSMCK